MISLDLNLQWITKASTLGKVKGCKELWKAARSYARLRGVIERLRGASKRLQGAMEGCEELCKATRSYWKATRSYERLRGAVISPPVKPRAVALMPTDSLQPVLSSSRPPGGAHTEAVKHTAGRRHITEEEEEEEEEEEARSWETLQLLYSLTDVPLFASGTRPRHVILLSSRRFETKEAFRRELTYGDYRLQTERGKTTTTEPAHRNTFGTHSTLNCFIIKKAKFWK